MSGILVTCEHCRGHGKVQCRCSDRPLALLRHESRDYGTEAAGHYIGRCLVCSQLWKVCWYSQNGDARFSWLKAGSSSDEHAFSFAEVVPFLTHVDLLHMPYVELLKHVPFDKLVECRKQLESDPALVGKI